MRNEKGVLLIELMFAAMILSLGIVALATAIHRSLRSADDDIALERAGEILEERAAMTVAEKAPKSDIELDDPVLGPAQLAARPLALGGERGPGSERGIEGRELTLTWRRGGRPRSVSIVVARPA